MFVPGFALLRRTSLDPVEKTVASIGLSIFFLYVSSFCIYLCRLPAVSYFAVTICIALAWISRRDLFIFFRSGEIRSLFASFAGLYLWTVALLAVIRNYSGGDWYGDWFEHYHRTLFFLDRLPANTLFLNLYLLPARPPLFNLVSAHFLGQLGHSFAVFQLTATLLNLTVFFPAYLFFRKLASGVRAGPLLLAILIGCNPLIVQNATYSWTKLLTAFYVLSGIWFFWQSFTRTESWLRHVAFLSLSIGLLTHYSAGPYLLLIALLYLSIVIVNKQFRWRELAMIAGVNVLVLSTWFAWSVTQFGFRATLLANTAPETSASFTVGESAAKVAANIRDTVVPHISWSVEMARFQGDDRWFSLREFFFWMYQENLPLALGVAGWLIAAIAMAKLAGRGLAGNRMELYLWIALVLGAIMLGIAVHGGRAPGGLANICLQPLVVLGVALVAAAYGRISPGLRALLLAGAVFDVCVGILLHFFFQHRMDPSTYASRQNWALKKQENLTFLSDSLSSYQLAYAAIFLGFVCAGAIYWEHKARRVEA